MYAGPVAGTVTLNFDDVIVPTPANQVRTNGPYTYGYYFSFYLRSAVDIAKRTCHRNSMSLVKQAHISLFCGDHALHLRNSDGCNVCRGVVFNPVDSGQSIIFNQDAFGTSYGIHSYPNFFSLTASSTTSRVTLQDTSGGLFGIVSFWLAGNQFDRTNVITTVSGTTNTGATTVPGCAAGPFTIPPGADPIFVSLPSCVATQLLITASTTAVPANALQGLADVTLDDVIVYPAAPGSGIQ